MRTAMFSALEARHFGDRGEGRNVVRAAADARRSEGPRRLYRKSSRVEVACGRPAPHATATGEIENRANSRPACTRARIEARRRDAKLETPPVRVDHPVFADHQSARPSSAGNGRTGTPLPAGSSVARRRRPVRALPVARTFGVGDPTMALDERHRFVAEIGDFNVVAPEIAALFRVGALRLGTSARR